MRYRLDVVATSVADVVEHAGGWLFDRSIAGWEVTVLVADPSDPRPLRILGADAIALEEVLASRGQGRRPHALAVACDVCQGDPRARRGLLKALGDGGIEVVVWGEGWPTPPEHRVDPVLHRLSVAAQAFKAQALTAAARPVTSVGTTEVFRSGLSDIPPVGADLSPVG
ncbi:hypothetical protein K7711_26430 [Nocardia sp. CA2R105]|uniref:Uncharacterized protein n=1 Tax=Nocardia jiangxiensis TaxID=282685 RepID=A0ABW6RTS9_9NOCA|nr:MULTISPECIES: hypothetical protein [Nocardia]MBY8860035.1 hypothetical protein [Nocardia coffeae]